MFKRGYFKTVRFAIAGLALTALGACATAEDGMKLSELESKVNEALQNAAAAKVDAATALHLAVENEKKLK